MELVLIQTAATDCDFNYAWIIRSGNDPKRLLVSGTTIRSAGVESGIAALAASEAPDLHIVGG